MMKKMNFQLKLLVIFLGFTVSFLCVESRTSSNPDAEVMQALKKSLNAPASLGWSDPDPCKWSHVSCSEAKRVTRIQIGHQNLQGTLPDLQNLSELQRLELQGNNISGPVPSLNWLSSLQVLMLSNNGFTLVPKDFFGGLTSLQSVEIDNNPFSDWEIPESLKNASSLQNFSANSASIMGRIPDFLGPNDFPGLSVLHLAFNNLDGGLPGSFSGSPIQSLWVNGQKSESKLTGGIDVIQNMTSLKEIWLHSNSFSGPLPEFSGLKELESLSLRDNFFTGPVPASLMNLESLKAVNLTNNLLQGPMPEFKPSVSLDMSENSNSFCQPKQGKCGAKVDTLLTIAKSMGYPRRFAENWKGNDPCADWIGITCSDGVITVLNLQKMNLSGTISSGFASLKSLQRLILSNNNLTGTIPEELTSLASLKQLDVSNNKLFGKVPSFRSNVTVSTDGNTDIGKAKSSSSPQGSAASGANRGERGILVIVLLGVLGVLLGVLGVLLVVLGVLLVVLFCRYKRKQNMVFSIQVLRNATNHFSEKNILGKGGFGTVYKGELHDGTKIAVKRMEGGVISGKGSNQFQSEIKVLTKVHHRHLVSLLGYCSDGNEKLLVYEYMPQGTLSRHLFNWKEELFGRPLEWKKRLTIALDVARGVEYLHKLAHQTFIHRDLKPSNILLGDDMRAKVADFGLVRLVPEGKGSIQTRIAGTFGYLAPEYGAGGRVTTKVDVFSFGVILMELVTGRKALLGTQPGESQIVPWFRKFINKDTFNGSTSMRESFRNVIDPTIELDNEILHSINTVAKLAGRCTAEEPGQRPDMSHTVNVLSSLVEFLKPSDPNVEDVSGIDLDMSSPQSLKIWQANEGRSYSELFSPSPLAGTDNTQTSTPWMSDDEGRSSLKSSSAESFRSAECVFCMDESFSLESSSVG